MHSHQWLRRMRAVVLLCVSALLTTTLGATALPASAMTSVDNPASPPTNEQLNEPTIAVSPRDPNRVITASNDLSSGLVGVYTSFDGAYTFHRASFLPLGGGSLEADPGLAFDSRGRAYASYLSYNEPNDGLGGLVVTRSDDGGLSWPNGRLVIANKRWKDGCTFADFPSIAIDRRVQRGGRPLDRIYVAWQHITSSPCGVTEVIADDVIKLVSSDDGGRTWRHLTSVPKPAGADPGNANVYVTANGAVLVAYTLSSPAKLSDCGGRGARPWDLRRRMMVASSSDSGEHWTTADAHPGVCIPLTVPVPVVGGEIGSLSGALYRLPANMNVVTDPVTGERVVVAPVADAVGGRTIDVSRSKDGKRWTRGGKLGRLPVEMLEFPRIAAAPDGTMYLLYISELPGSVLLAKMVVSHNDGRTWSAPITLSSMPGVPDTPFNQAASLLFIGDYVGNTVGPDGAVHPVWTDARLTGTPDGDTATPFTKIFTAHLRP